jgi:hypothetical protein
MFGRAPGVRRDYDPFYWIIAFATVLAWVTLYALCVAVLFHAHLIL